MRAPIDSQATLLYWLGPWAPRGRLPPRVARHAVAHGALYTPIGRAVRGAWLVSPGLSPSGPDDVRVDRLARILAASGLVVLSPSIPTLRRLELRAAAVDELARAFDDLHARAGGGAVSVFSLSVGALAALRLAADPAYQSRLARCVLFGGYADMRALLDTLTEEPAPADPLNTALALLAVLEYVPTTAAARAAVAAAWRDYLAEVWPRPELKRAGSLAHVPIAHAHAERLPPAQRELFLIGCGALPGARAVVADALAAGAALAPVDPRSSLASVRCPVDVIHARGDEVIPFRHAELLAAHIPGARLHPLESFGHSRFPRLADWGRATAAWRDLRTLRHLAAAIATTEVHP